MIESTVRVVREFGSASAPLSAGFILRDQVLIASTPVDCNYSQQGANDES